VRSGVAVASRARASSGPRIAPTVLVFENLYDHRVSNWEKSSARLQADKLLVKYGNASIWILLGRRVADAFGHSLPFFEVQRSQGLTMKARMVLRMALPHTSGRNRYWNDPKNIARAKRVLKDLMRVAGL